ncbi:hypothetical protein [Streptomyces sp. Ac-502]|uniref:hypothetical protein n=1 Tax=Streptomyces sp. Ac-502 TaxID=3342801 RepID=UPI00386273AA
MNDATCASTTSTIAPHAIGAEATDYPQPTAPSARPGKLTVQVFDDELKTDTDRILNQTADGITVSVTATLLRVVPAHDDRIGMVLADVYGETGMVTVDAAVVMDAARAAGGPIRPGQKLSVAGPVVYRLPAMATIDGRSIRVVTA